MYFYYNGNRTGSNLYDMWNYDASNELLSYGNGGSPIANLTYNDNGSVISYMKNGNTFNFIYNPLERISEVDLNGNLLSKYTYDPLGERVKKEIYSNGTLSNSIIYFYGQEGLLAEYDENMNLIKKYIYNPDRPWGTDPLWQEDSSGNHYFYINDHLFTPQKMVDENLNTVWQGDWQSFGSVNELVNTVENNLRFPGQYYDSETGFYYNFNRYYFSETGQYFREDPIRISNKLLFYPTFISKITSGVINNYSYSFNRPTSVIDSFGLNVIDTAKKYVCMCEHCKNAPPLPSTSPECDKYGNRVYAGVSLRCFCKCAGDSYWSRKVRGCLRCMDELRSPMWFAHFCCYDIATGATGSLGVPYFKEIECYYKCSVLPYLP